MKTFILKTSLFGDENINRTIEIIETNSLYQLAVVIVAAYDFNFDHCFGFYDNIKNDRYHESKKQYELFADLDNVEPTPAESVKRTKVSEVWKRQGDKMVFLFDYGDGWRFMVELIGFGKKESGKKYPAVIDKEGVAPEQYPSIEEEEYLEIEDGRGSSEFDFFESKTLAKTHAGSKNGKFRYWVVVSCLQGKKIAPSRKKRLKDSFSSIARENKSVELENIDFYASYALCTVLISPARAVGEVFDNAILFCNGNNPFLAFHYLVTNVTKPTPVEIKNYLAELAQSKHA